MIGDSWDADIVGAMQFGMDQVYFCPLPGKLPPQVGTGGSSRTKTTVIAHLEELLDLL